MVLRQYFFRICFINKLLGKGPFIVFLVFGGCLLIVGCQGAKAKFQTEKDNCQIQELKLDEKQLAYLQDSVEKFFQWRAYWTYSNEKSQSSYKGKMNQQILIEIFNFKHGVFVLIPSLDYSIIAFRKSPTGVISNWHFIRSGANYDGDILKVTESIDEWDYLLLFTGLISEKGASYGGPKTLSENERKNYVEKNRDKFKYCLTRSLIQLLPLTVPTYAPMDEMKQTILEKITQEATELSKDIVDEGDAVTIFIPNFNLNDGRVWIVLESKDETYTWSLLLNTINIDSPVTQGSYVEIKSKPKNGILLGADEKIRRNAIKKLIYKR